MFKIPSMMPKNDIPSGDTGDNTVPFPGAIPPFWDESEARKKLVCLTKDDFALIGEILERGLGSKRMAGFHGILPAMDLVHRLICRHFTGGSDKYGNTWGRPAPGVPDAEWNPPFEMIKKGY
jgi:hypothetical protein